MRRNSRGKIRSNGRRIEKPRLEGTGAKSTCTDARLFSPESLSGSQRASEAALSRSFIRGRFQSRKNSLNRCGAKAV